MTYYMISEGVAQVEELFFAESKEEVIEKARALINQWPEYVGLTAEEIIYLAEAGDLEFDLVPIEGDIPPPGTPKSELLEIYESQWGG